MLAAQVDHRERTIGHVLWTAIRKPFAERHVSHQPKAKERKELSGAEKSGKEGNQARQVNILDSLSCH